MTTLGPTSAVFNGTTVAGWRQTITDFLNAITNNNWSLSGTAFAKWVQTSDTGQMTPTTLASATQPAVSAVLASNGYVCFKFNDTQQGTTPIVVKFEFGTGASTNSLGVWVTVGSAFNGSGGITAVTTRTLYTLLPVSTTTAYNTYSCSIDGAFALVYKNGGFTSSVSFVFAIGRTCDTTGVPTADGYEVFVSVSNATLASQSCNGAGAGSAMTANAAKCTIIGGLTSTLVGGVAQTFPFFAAIPAVFGVYGFLEAIATECPAGTAITDKPFGSTSHTYMPLTLGGSQLANVAAQTGTVFCIPWE